MQLRQPKNMVEVTQVFLQCTVTMQPCVQMRTKKHQTLPEMLAESESLAFLATFHHNHAAMRTNAYKETPNVTRNAIIL